MTSSEANLWDVGGWFGALTNDDPRQHALSCMIGETPGPADSPLTHLDRSGSIFLSSGTPGRDLAVERGVCAAIFGVPWWSDPDLASVAQRIGHAGAAVAAYRRFGRNLLDHLHGPFGLVVLDNVRMEALLAIDRVGIQPLAYALKAGGGVVFSTSAAAVARHPAVGAHISPQGLFNYLFFSYRVPAPDSIFANVEKLLPGQAISVRPDRVERWFYWQMPFSRDRAVDRRELGAALFESLRTGVKRAAGDPNWERLGTFLSGGLDSSTVTGLVAEISPSAVKAFTIGFDSPGYDEREYAKIAARHFRVDHRIYEVTPADVLDAIPRIAAAYDEPFANASAVPVYYCAHFAKSQGIDRLIAGDGGDELFAGNAGHLRMKIFELYDILPARVRRGLIEPVVACLPRGEWNLLGHKARRYIEQANVPMPERVFGNSRELIARASGILHPDWLESIDVERPIDILREVYRRPAEAAFEQRFHQMELQVVLADNDLRKVNRMCALAGVEVRYPMLDEAVCEFSASIPPKLLLEGLRLRAFFKKAMVGFLPPATLKKRKHGFGLPLGPWLEPGSAILDFALDCLGSLRQRTIFTPSYIEAVIERHRANPEELNADPIWEMMMLELWLSSHGVSTARTNRLAQVS